MEKNIKKCTIFQGRSWDTMKRTLAKDPSRNEKNFLMFLSVKAKVKIEER